MDHVEQLELLLSTSADHAMTSAQRTELAQALRDEPGAVETARQYARLNKLLTAWRTVPPEVDWEQLSRRTSDQIVSEIAPDGVDSLLRRAARPLPELNWEAMKNRISAAVHQEAARAGQSDTVRPLVGRWGLRWAWRAGLPLAAAAAVALLVWTPRSVETQLPKEGDRGSGRSVVQVALLSPEHTGSVSVTFEGTPPGGKQPEAGNGIPEGGVQFISPPKNGAVTMEGGGVTVIVDDGSALECGESEEYDAEALIY